MARGIGNAGLRDRLDTLFNFGLVAGLSDGQLVEQFLTGNVDKFDGHPTLIGFRVRLHMGSAVRVPDPCAVTAGRREEAVPQGIGNGTIHRKPGLNDAVMLRVRIAAIDAVRRRAGLDARSDQTRNFLDEDRVLRRNGTLNWVRRARMIANRAHAVKAFVFGFRLNSERM